MKETHVRFLILQTTYPEYVRHAHGLQVWYIFVTHNAALILQI
jgi:hypothetical protein